MDILDFDVILDMDWLTAHQVVIDCDSRRITAMGWYSCDFSGGDDRPSSY